MKIISSTLCGFIDNIIGLTLLLPYIIQYNIGNTDSLFLTAVGSFILLNNMHTDYEFSPIKLIPMNWHLIFNAFAGLVLCFSPFIINYEHYRLWPFAMGLFLLAVCVLTTTKPYVKHGSPAPTPLGRYSNA